MMNKILFFTTHSVNENSKQFDDQEYKSIYKSIRDTNHEDDFTLDVAEAVTRDNFEEQISNLRYKIIHFTGNCNFELQAGFQVLPYNSELSVDYISTSSLGDCFESIGDDLLCIVFNGKHTEDIAKSLARFSRFTIGTTRVVNKNEAEKFAKTFFKYLAENRVVYDVTVVDAFLKGVSESKIFSDEDRKEQAYALFTTKFNTLSEKKLGTTPVRKIQTKPDYYEAMNDWVDSIGDNKKKLSLFEANLKEEFVHKKMISWIDDNIDPILEKVVDQAMEVLSIEDRNDYLFDLGAFVTIIKNTLKYNTLDQLKNHGVDYEYKFSDYQLAFGLLDKAITLYDSNFEEHSRHFLSQILKHLNSSYISE